ncbi:MAG: mechanosensitive ion channel domain-containing protein [Candidatus Binatia bacterium]
MAPIPLAEINTESESVLAFTRDLSGDLSADHSTAAVSQQLPGIAREIDDRLRESRKIVAQLPSIEVLLGLEGEWNRMRYELRGLSENLTGRVNELEHSLARLDELAETWDQTLAASKDNNAPPELLARIETVTAELRQAREVADKQRALALTMQSRVAVQDSRITDAFTSIEQARKNALSRILLQDSPPIWSPAIRSSQNLQKESWSSFSRQWTTLRAYAERQIMRFALGIVTFFVLTGILFWVRQRARKLPAEETALSAAAAVFAMPFTAAFVLSLLAGRWIFPQAPRLLWGIIGVVALIPSVTALRRLVRPDFYAALYALITFFLIDHLRTLTAAVQFLPRLLFLVEMISIALVSIWVPRFTVDGKGSPPNRLRWGWAIRLAANLSLAASVAALLANALGYVSFSNLLGGALLEGGYLGLVLYATVEVLDGLVMIALSVRPFSTLSAINRHRLLVRHRIRRVLQAVAIALWVFAVLQRLLIREQLLDFFQEFLSAQLVVGSISTSPGDILAFGLTIWSAFLVSRFVRFLLDEDVYPRVRLNRGLSYAISNTLHYLILIVGFFVGVAALGFDMTRVTILAGAFSVGVGLGLQNIFNNFISGLILLFERPINIGDVVQIEDASGVVERIGIRASIIRDTNGSEIIMPNGKLISERLINWTLSSRQHGIELPISVTQNANPEHVIALLEQTAAAQPSISGDPPPQALVVKLGPDAIGFELRAWTDRSEQWMQIRSELAIAISAVLASEKIAIR